MTPTGTGTLPAREKRKYIEEVGLLFETSGMPRMAGRVLGWLLICEPAHQSAQSIGEALGASKASISTMVRLLVQHDVVERVGVPGERATCYRIRPGSWSLHMRRRLTYIEAFRSLAEKGLKLLADQPRESRARLQEMRDLHAFLEKEMPAMLDRYEAQVKTWQKQ